MRATVAVALAFGGLAGLVGPSACVHAPRMCTADTGCGPNASCVAGRCLSSGASAAIATATRLVYDPIDAVYLRPGAPGATGGLAVLGRGDGAVVLLRYGVPLSPSATVLEAYLLLEREPDVDVDPAAIFLHAESIASAWDSRATSWATQPLLEERHWPETRVMGTSPRLVRIEVHALVELWRKRAHDCMGVAVVAEGRTPTGVPFGLPPRLELYVK